MQSKLILQLHDTVKDVIKGMFSMSKRGDYFTLGSRRHDNFIVRLIRDSGLQRRSIKFNSVNLPKVYLDSRFNNLSVPLDITG